MPTRAARYYPVAGWLVGLISGVIFWCAAQFGNHAVAATLAITVGVLVTGGFHEDGLADSADGLGGGRTAEHRLEIMKDSRIGTFGGLALLLVTALRIAGLATLSPEQGFLALIAAHSLARAAPITLMRFGSYVGDPTSAKLPHTDMRVTGPELAVALFLAVLPAILLPLYAVILSVAAVISTSVLVWLYANRLIGGFTGDVLGCVEQLAEASILIVLSYTLTST
jgi:adenosylcobinamide-GDP ribazoletransferase